MAELTGQQEQQLRDTIDRIVMEDDRASSADAVSLSGAKDLFCQHWDTVKQVLGFLLPYLPGIVKYAVQLLIKIGDAVHGQICDS